jgi:hypothetical protein
LCGGGLLFGFVVGLAFGEFWFVVPGAAPGVVLGFVPGVVPFGFVPFGFVAGAVEFGAVPGAGVPGFVVFGLVPGVGGGACGVAVPAGGAAVPGVPFVPD